MNLGPGFDGTGADGLPKTVWWVSKSIGAAGDPPKGTLQVTEYNVETGQFTNPPKVHPPFDPASPPADLPQGFKDYLKTENGKKWYADPPAGATQCSVDLDQDGLRDIDEMNLDTDPTATDTDRDGVSDGREVKLGSDPKAPLSRPEDRRADSSCRDGVDNDGDGLTDRADPGCLDTDDDEVPNARDNCPLQANPDQIDWDGDGLGAPCDEDDDGDMIADAADQCPDTIATDEDVDLNGCTPYQLTPQSRVQTLIADVEEARLPRGLRNSLVSKLENALRAILRGNRNAAINHLHAFVNEVNAHRGRQIAEPLAVHFLEAVQDIESRL